METGSTFRADHERLKVDVSTGCHVFAIRKCDVSASCRWIAHIEVDIDLVDMRSFTGVVSVLGREGGRYSAARCRQKDGGCDVFPATARCSGRTVYVRPRCHSTKPAGNSPSPPGCRKSRWRNSLNIAIVYMKKDCEFT